MTGLLGPVPGKDQVSEQTYLVLCLGKIRCDDRPTWPCAWERAGVRKDLLGHVPGKDQV